MKNIIIMVLLGLSTFTLSAQKKAGTAVEVKGEVRDSLSNETIPYVTVKISEAGKPGQTFKILSTDQNGKFQVSLSKDSTYLFYFNSVGKSMKTQTIEVKQEDKTLDIGKILLTDQNVLTEVVVSAFKPLVQVDLDKITYSTEDDPDAKTNNVLEMLKKVPMVTVDAEDKIELKGSGSFKFYLDGKPSNLISNNPSQVLKSMPAVTVKSIEVITDPGAKYDAEGVTGIINIVTNKQPMGGYTASVNAGADNKGGYNAGGYLSMKYNKIGFTGNYNYYKYKSPDSPSNSYRMDKISSTNKYLYQDGHNEYEGKGSYGSGEVSYEIDTLNLISVGFNLFNGKGGGTTDYSVEMQDENHLRQYAYSQIADNSNTYGGSDMNANYQRTFRKKDELLTASYKYSFSPNDSEGETRIENAINYPNQWQKQFSDAEMKEHTFQIDYTTPLAKIHTLEGGAKYIIRLNESNSQHSEYNNVTNEWINIQGVNSQFHHRQDILSAYGGYNLRFKKYGFKVGLRAEETKLKAEFPKDESRNFDAEFFNLIPSTTVSYQLKPTQTFRLGYNMRIQRPGIWYLNPYINNTDPRYVTQGNPDLEVEKSHNFNLNYNYFHPKFNMNASTFYNYMGNSIQRVTTIDNDKSYTTYDNIGKENQVGLYLYMNWNPVKLLRFYTNISSSYTDIRATDDSGLANYGFQGRGYVGIQFNLPLDFSVSLNGGGSTANVNLQGSNSGYQFYSMSVNKNFLKKKLTFSIRGSNLFEKYRHYSSEQETDQFYFKSENNYLSRSFGISVSYRFGEMKQQIKKVQRGISNDDTKQGEGGGGTPQGGGGQ